MAHGEAVESDREIYRCQKHQIDLDSANLTCIDPKLYCQFRSSCLIHFLERERRRNGE